MIFDIVDPGNLKFVWKCDLFFLHVDTEPINSIINPLMNDPNFIYYISLFQWRHQMYW